ncbi:Increased rDNA silencing protein [Arthrobotrys musiformis]|uniref:Increased rDNA silencing protein n=1 Tax=Arthrobotrys musiformis TaxID=47236 RepID=A0AAV9WAG1_9PEZI
MTSTTYAANGFHEPGFTTPQKQKRFSTSASNSSSVGTNTDKPDAALRAATLSFSPPFARQPSDERPPSSSSSFSASPSKPKTNGTALIAARVTGTGNSNPSDNHRRSLSRNSSFDLLASSTNNTANTANNNTHGGSLKAARLSVSRSSSTGSGAVSRAKSPSRTERSYSEDVSSGYIPVDGSLIAAKLSAARKDSTKGLPIPASSSTTVAASNRNDTSPPSLLAAGLAVSRSTTPGTMANNSQPERDQEPDILPPAGSVNEARKRFLQQVDAAEGGGGGTDSPVRGRRSLEGPMRSKNSGTFFDTPPTSTVNISPLSAAKLAVQHSGRNAGSAGSGPRISKPRQPSPIKKEIKRDITPTTSPTTSRAPGPVAPPPKPPALLKKPTIQSIKVTQTPLPSTAPPTSPKPAPKPPVALKKLTTQETGTPPPQPIKPLPRRTRPPARASTTFSVPDASSPTSVSPKATTPVEITSSPTRISKVEEPKEATEKAAPPPPLPRNTKPTVEAPKPVEPAPVPAAAPTPAPARRDPRMMGFNTVKLPPPTAGDAVVEPIKQSPVKTKPTPKSPVRQVAPTLPPKPTSPTKVVDHARAVADVPIKKPKPELPAQKTFVDSIVSRHPQSMYNLKEKNVSSSTVSLLPPPPATATYKIPSTSKSAQTLRPNHTGPDSTRSSLRPTPSWRDDTYDILLTEGPIRPSHTGDSLHHAILASSLASSRAGSPVKSNPIPLPPRPTHGLRPTMRSPDKLQDRDNSPQKKSHNILGKKHPNKHNEGARKRWREFVTEKERKRYEGLWAANRGLYLNERMFESRPDAQGKKLHLDAVCAVVVKDLWSRSRLPVDILEQVWDLVDRGPRPKWWLTREEFIMGLWLIDQSLKGRKLPGKVQDGTWESVRRLGIVLKPYEELGLKEKKVKKR